MVELKQHVVMSHLHPVGGAILARRETRRMGRWLAACRLKRQSVAWLTLTYDIKQWGDTPGESIYEALRRHRHVSRFFVRLGKQENKDYRGLWRAKLEFTEAGNPHFHILIRNWKYIPNERIEEAWGHGFSSVTRAKRWHAAYIAKYQCKGGKAEYPEFIYDKKPKSVQIWGTSFGFFKFTEAVEDEVRAKAAQAGWTPAPDVERRRRCVVAVRRNRIEGDTIGEICRKSLNTTVARTENGEPEHLPVCLHTINCMLAISGSEYVGSTWGADLWDCALSDIRFLAAEGKRYLELDASKHEFEDKAEYYATLNDMYTQSGGFGDGSEAETEPSGGEAAALILFKYQGCSHPDAKNLREEKYYPSTIEYTPIPRDQWPDEYAPF